MNEASGAAGRRWEIRPGADVVAAGERVGEVLHVVVSPHQRKVTGFVVRLVHGREVYVPADWVIDAQETAVHVAFSAAELEALPAWEPERFTPAALSWPGWRELLRRGALLTLPGRLRRPSGLVRRIEGVAPSGPDTQEAIISRGQRVVCADGPVGRVDLVLVDAETDRVQHIVVRRGALFSRDVAIPVDWVRSITPDMVVLEATRESVARLPVYRPDDELKEDVEDVLSREELVRALDLPVRVDVEDGVVRLRGFVYNHAVRSRLEELARSVPGVVDVRNDLAVDMDLLQRVVAALQSDPRTRSLRGYRIEVREGVVELEGSVASIDAATALEEVVASVSDIRGIANHLVGPEIPDHWRRVVQPEIGQPVLASDRELGRVQYVVVHPRTRRVEGIVVNAVSPEPGSLPFAETPVRSRLLVIPVSEVERITPAGVFLRVHGGRAAEYPEFSEETYRNPPSEWVPPFPYHPGQVRLLPLDHA
jgi:osmotically-inducible protein OsmY/sporulation protein YlmC with PRC-barrel domain